MRLGLRNAPGVSFTATHLRTARDRHNTLMYRVPETRVRSKKQNARAARNRRATPGVLLQSRNLSVDPSLVGRATDVSVMILFTTSQRDTATVASFKLEKITATNRTSVPPLAGRVARRLHLLQHSAGRRASLHHNQSGNLSDSS